MQDINDFEHHDTTMGQPRRPSMQEPRIVGYQCTTHSFATTGKAALQLHMSHYNDCSAGPVREDAAPVIDHQCEAWQQGFGANGFYCMACGKPARPKRDITLNKHDPLPKYEHDCDECIFLGTETVGGHEHDLYFHPDERQPTVIARESSEGGDYRSGLEFVDRDGALALAYVRALRRGLI